MTDQIDELSNSTLQSVAKKRAEQSKEAGGIGINNPTRAKAMDLLRKSDNAKYRHTEHPSKVTPKTPPPAPTEADKAAHAKANKAKVDSQNNRGYGEGRYMGDSVEQTEVVDQLDEAGLGDIVKGIKRKFHGKLPAKEVEHDYARSARSAIKYGTDDQANKAVDRFVRVSKVVSPDAFPSNYKAPKRGANEEVESLDELSMDTVKSYKEKAAKNPAPSKTTSNILHKAIRRFAGKERAEDRIHSDEMKKMRARLGLKNEEVLDEDIGSSIKKGIKSIKRGFQGWSDTKMTPGSIQKRTKELTDDELADQRAQRDEPRTPEVGKHSPVGLQRRLHDREKRKRDLANEEVLTEGAGIGDLVKFHKISGMDGHRYAQISGFVMSKKDGNIDPMTGRVHGTATHYVAKLKKDPLHSVNSNPDVHIPVGDVKKVDQNAEIQNHKMRMKVLGKIKEETETLDTFLILDEDYKENNAKNLKIVRDHHKKLLKSGYTYKGSESKDMPFDDVRITHNYENTKGDKHSMSYSAYAPSWDDDIEIKHTTIKGAAPKLHSHLQEEVLDEGKFLETHKGEDAHGEPKPNPKHPAYATHKKAYDAKVAERKATTFGLKSKEAKPKTPTENPVKMHHIEAAISNSFPDVEPYEHLKRQFPHLHKEDHPTHGTKLTYWADKAVAAHDKKHKSLSSYADAAYKDMHDDKMMGEDAAQKNMTNAMDTIDPVKRDAARKQYKAARDQGLTHASSLSLMHQRFGKANEEVLDESDTPDRMKGKQKPYVSSDGKGNYEVLGNTGQTKATFSRATHGKDAHASAQRHLRAKYSEYMKEETLDEEVKTEKPAHKVGDTVWAASPTNKALTMTGKVTKIGQTLTTVQHKDGSEAHYPHKLVNNDYEVLHPNPYKKFQREHLEQTGELLSLTEVKYMIENANGGVGAIAQHAGVDGAGPQGTGKVKKMMGNKTDAAAIAKIIVNGAKSKEERN